MRSSSVRAALPQPLGNLFANIFPGPSGARIDTVGLKAVLEYPSMPIRHRYRLRMDGDVVPQGLDVVELLVGSQVVKSGRWKAGQWLGHDSTSVEV
jgi:hypothetical protein